jgi:hypothetical protein
MGAPGGHSDDARAVGFRNVADHASILIELWKDIEAAARAGDGAKARHQLRAIEALTRQCAGHIETLACLEDWGL